MADRKMCICCGKDIAGRAVELNPPDSKMALCRSCNTAQRVLTRAESEEILRRLEARGVSPDEVAEYIRTRRVTRAEGDDD